MLRGCRAERFRVGTSLACSQGFRSSTRRCGKRTGVAYSLIVIQEAGLDGFGIHRCLEKEGIESHVVDVAFNAASRCSRRAETDRLDGEALVRALLGY